LHTQYLLDRLLVPTQKSFTTDVSREATKSPNSSTKITKSHLWEKALRVKLSLVLSIMLSVDILAKNYFYYRWHCC